MTCRAIDSVTTVDFPPVRTVSSGTAVYAFDAAVMPGAALPRGAAVRVCNSTSRRTACTTGTAAGAPGRAPTNSRRPKTAAALVRTATCRLGGISRAAGPGTCDAFTCSFAPARTVTQTWGRQACRIATPLRKRSSTMDKDVCRLATRPCLSFNSRAQASQRRTRAPIKSSSLPIHSLVDGGNLLHPPAPLRVLQIQDRLRRPVKVVRDEGYLPVKRPKGVA